MRKLNTGDVFKTARLMKESDILPIVKESFARGKEDGADERQVGIDFISGVLCACSGEKTEAMLYELLGGIWEKKPDDVRNQSLETTVGDILRIVEENNVANFLKSASRLAGKIHK